MYLQISKTTQKERPRGLDTIITHIGLYKDDGTYIKFVKHTESIIDKIKAAKIDITIPELEGLIQEHEVDKIIPPREPNLFDSLIPWPTPKSDTKSVSKK
jgi:hypothetical protein